jgi:glycosyltransferase involved in cell wall biosynthesis
LKIVFFNRFFHPDTSATSQILSDLAFYLASKGFEIHAVASYNGGDSREEVIHGVHVHRVAPASTHHGLFRRALEYLRYYLGARRAAHRIVEAGDIVVLKTDPPLLAPAMTSLVKARGAKLVVWLQDLFPEVARAYGVPTLQGALYTRIRRARDKALQRADVVVAIAESMARLLAPSRREGIHVIHNWADGATVLPIAASNNPLRNTWGLENKFVIEYSGNFGRVHEFDTIIEAARILQDDPGIIFLMVGRGPRLAATRLNAAQLPNVRFEPHQLREMVPQVLATADVHLAVLRPEFEGLVHPSKLYGIMAAGRPTIFVGSINGECATILEQAQCGLSIQLGNVEALVSAIMSLKADSARREVMGTNARAAFNARFDRSIAVASWRHLFESLGARAEG